MADRPRANRVAIREGYIRSAYEDADEKLAHVRALMGKDPITFAGSDHGFAPQYLAVNANKVLNDATVGGVSLHASGAGTSNCSAGACRTGEFKNVAAIGEQLIEFFG